MKLIFIRHAEPDYSTGSLTEKGFKEAKLLASRIKEWKVDEFYCSPIQRAILTAKPTLSLCNREAITLDWIQEFKEFVHDDVNHPGQDLWPWDFMPQYLEAHPELFKNDEWYAKGILTTGPIKAHYDRICSKLDAFLASYGYVRDGLIYNSPQKNIATNHYMVYDGDTINHMKDAKVDETTLVFFCHQEITLVLMSHLLNLPLPAMWQGFFVPPASVTVLASEERAPGLAYFRCQVFGSTTHLHQADEPVSDSGHFAAAFSK